MQGMQSSVANDLPLTAALYLGTRRHVAPVHTQSVLEEQFIRLILLFALLSSLLLSISCLFSRYDRFSSCLQDLSRVLGGPQRSERKLHRRPSFSVFLHLLSPLQSGVYRSFPAF